MPKIIKEGRLPKEFGDNHDPTYRDLMKEP